MAELAMDVGAVHRLRRLRRRVQERGAHICSRARRSAHLGLLPQGQPERGRRVIRMVEQMDTEGFGSCSNEGECEAVCPKEISISNIARMNRDYVRAVAGKA